MASSRTAGSKRRATEPPGGRSPVACTLSDCPCRQTLALDTETLEACHAAMKAYNVALALPPPVRYNSDSPDAEGLPHSKFFWPFLAALEEYVKARQSTQGHSTTAEFGNDVYEALRAYEKLKPVKDIDASLLAKGQPAECSGSNCTGSCREAYDAARAKLDVVCINSHCGNGLLNLAKQIDGPNAAHVVEAGRKKQQAQQYFWDHDGALGGCGNSTYFSGDDDEAMSESS